MSVNLQQITPNDLAVYNENANFNFAVGNTVTLKAGSLTTTTNVAATKPANGSYTTFITDPSGIRISSNGVSAAVVPEANTAALLGLALPTIGTVVMARRRNKKA